jgi:hypothetical protein
MILLDTRFFGTVFDIRRINHVRLGILGIYFTIPFEDYVSFYDVPALLLLSGIQMKPPRKGIL